jgi:transposase
MRFHMVHTGPVRQDDRRIISGIAHRLREGCRWRGLPAEYGPYTTVFNRYNRWSKRGLWQDIFAALASCGEPQLGVAMIDSTAVPAHRAASGAKGERGQAIGRSRGGRTTKIHALIDHAGRPLAFRLSGGNIADITVAAPLLCQLAPSAWLIGDKGYDAIICAPCSKAEGPSPSSPTKPIASASSPSTPSATSGATSSSAPTAASRTSAPSPPATTSSPATSAPACTSSPL